METRDAIVEAACDAIHDKGIAAVTIAGVAARADVSSALVHYHFGTKTRLLVAAAERIALSRLAARSAALGAPAGLQLLDVLWEALASGSGWRVERSWHDLAMLAREEPSVRQALDGTCRSERMALAAALPRLLAALGATPTIPADELASVVQAFLDGLVLQLDAGTPSAEVRTAYDAFWLAVAASVPGR
jgi:AcrR family transcriptional regulator